MGVGMAMSALLVSCADDESFIASHENALRFTFCSTPLSSANTRLSLTSCGSSLFCIAEVSSTNTRMLSPFLISTFCVWNPASVPR